MDRKQYFPNSKKREATHAAVALVIAIRMQKLLKLVSIKPIKHYAKRTN